MTESLLPIYHTATIGPLAKPHAVHLNGSLPDHTADECPADDTCSVFVEWYRCKR
jgi:hypothetical protein